MLAMPTPTNEEGLPVSSKSCAEVDGYEANRRGNAAAAVQYQAL